MSQLRIAAILAIICTASGATAGTTTYYSPQFCKAEFLNYYSTDYEATYSTTAIVNTSSVSAFEFFECPAQWSVAGSANGIATVPVIIDAATVVYRTYSSTTSVFFCSVFQENWDQSYLYSSKLYACSTQGGCASSQSSPYYVGKGQLNFTNPIGTGSSHYTQAVGMTCYVSTADQISAYNVTLN